MSVDFTAGVLAPWLTTYSEDISYQIGFTALGLPKETGITVSKDIQSVKGSVCIDDWTSVFFCKFQGLKAKTSDEVAILLPGASLNEKQNADHQEKSVIDNDYPLFMQ